MAPVDIVPLAPAHLPAAARLVARRQERLIAAEPALPERYTDPSAVQPRIAAQLGADGAVGRAAIGLDGALVGFLLSVPRTAWRWGASAWSILEASASTDPEALRDLYAATAVDLVERGLLAHYVEVPCPDPEALRAWYDLGFAHMHEYGLRETDASDLPTPDGITFRRAVMDDRAIVERLASVISDTQALTPSYAVMSSEARAAERSDYLEEIEGEDGFWLALDAADGRPLGMTISYAPDAGLAVPDGATYLGATMTLPGERRRGVATALLRFVLDRALASGSRHCVTNWRTTNLVASRTWPRLGFRRTHHRLVRLLDERVAAAPARDAA